MLFLFVSKGWKANANSTETLMSQCLVKMAQRQVRMDSISALVKLVDRDVLSSNLFCLAKDPLPCRCLNFTIPGHSRCTLYEADDFIAKMLEGWGYDVEQEAVSVQAFRPDATAQHGFKKPEPSDSWYTAHNLYAKRRGLSSPKEVILIIAHKDSQSWLGCAPGAYDNAVGTVATMEIARLLADYASQRSVWFLFCNEEHWPWTSVAAAQSLARTDLNVFAILNIDSIGGKSSEDKSAGRMVNVTRYSTLEGEKLADLFAELNEEYEIGLMQKKYFSPTPNDDDGSFIKAGFSASVLNIGSFPYVEPHYHTGDDGPENVDLENVRLATQLTLATVLHLDTFGKRR